MIIFFTNKLSFSTVECSEMKINYQIKWEWYSISMQKTITQPWI